MARLENIVADLDVGRLRKCVIQVYHDTEDPGSDDHLWRADLSDSLYHRVCEAYMSQPAKHVKYFPYARDFVMHLWISWRKSLTKEEKDAALVAEGLVRKKGELPTRKNPDR